MTERFITDNPELDALFERYRQAPRSHVFAPLADACRKAGLVDEAIDIVDRGVEENPGYTSGHVVRGKCYYERGDRKMAVSCFERVLELDPNNLVALKFLGLIQAEAGDAVGARERFKHILALDPDDREIRRELDILDVPATEPARDRAEDPPADDEASSPSAGDIDADNEFEGAPISLEVGDDPTTDELATMTLADIYAEQGYAEKALRIYREVLRRQPDNNGVRAKIRALGGEVDDIAPAKRARPVDEGGMNHFDDAPMMEAAVDDGIEDAGHETPERVDSAEDAPAGASGLSPAPGVAIELPPPEDMEPEEPRGEAPHEAPDEEERPRDDAPEFEEIDAGDEAEAAPSARDGDDPNSPIPYRRPGGTIDEGRSYEQFKRWLKNLTD